MNIVRNAIRKAEKKLTEASLALQDIEHALVFVGFDDNDKPQISSCNGGNEIILVWHGREIDANQIVSCMSKKKCIESNDFIVMK